VHLSKEDLGGGQTPGSANERDPGDFISATLANLRFLCKNVRIVRKSSPLLSSLFNGTTQGVLGATLLRPAKEWYLSDLASFLGLGPSSLQRALSKLSRSGILLRRRDGNRVYYRADPACPILAELASILTKTSGIAEPLHEALTPLARKIELAFIHGSVAESRERSESDIDLIIVGDVANGDVALALRPLQDRLGREVNATRYTTREFAATISNRQHFLLSVLKKPKIFLIGGEDELEEIIGRSTGGASADEQEGT
jgi:DNA-binding transcriptional ArsR family regulator